MYKEEDRDGFKRSLKCRSVVRNIRTKRINLYQREVKRCRCRADCYIGGIFSIPVRFSQVGIVMPMERADRAEAAYQRMEAQLEVMKQANSIMPEVKQNMPTMEIPGEMIRKQ